MNFDVNQVGDFKKVIDEIITAKLQSYGITSYIAAKVTGVNNDGTVNVSIPPDDNRYVNNVLNKSNEILSVGDSVELCTKNGKLSNAWVALKHGASTSSGGGNYILDDLPIGAQFAYSNANEIPLGCLVCDGSAVSRTDYSELFAVIGTTYGAGDGSTTFNLPNKRGRVSVGLDTAQDEFNAIGKHIGEKTHTLTINEIPSHSHRGRYLTNSNISTAYNVGYRVSPSAENPTDFNDYVGGSQSHNNIQPSEVDIWLIKAKQRATNILPDAIIYNGLDSTSTTDALSANMGNVLNDKIENNTTELDALNDKLNQNIGYQIGDIVITSTNENPSSRFGGTWELFDKEFKYDGGTVSDCFTANSTNVTSHDFKYVRSGHSIFMRLNIVNKVALTDTTLDLGVFDWEKLGFTSLYYGMFDLLGASDGGQAIVMARIQAGGEMTTTDVHNINGSHNIAAGSVTYWNFTYPIRYPEMLDSACDKFYWKRIS